MVIMQHIFQVTRASGIKETIVAIAVILILEGNITDTGVHIPINRSIYKPVLSELAKLGISMKESKSELS